MNHRISFSRHLTENALSQFSLAGQKKREEAGRPYHDPDA